MSTLTNRNINETYFGLLKTNDNQSIDSLTRVTDGLGCDTSISINCGDQGTNTGLTVHGNITFNRLNGFNFPDVGSSNNDVVIVNNDNITLGNVSSVLDVCSDNLCFNGNVLNLTENALDRKNVFNPTGTVYITAETSGDRYYRSNNGKTCICFSGLSNSGFQKNTSGQYKIRINLFRRVARGDFHLKSSVLKTTTGNSISKFGLETNGDYRTTNNDYFGNSHIEILDDVSGRIVNIPNFSVGHSYNFNF